MRRFLRLFSRIFLGLLLLLAGLVAVSAVANRSRPEQSAAPEQLGPAEQARLAELLHLRRELGDEIWAEYGSADIPLIIYNEAYAFLLNYPDEAPVGWTEVPSMATYGEAWEPVPNASFAGRPVYRQPLREDVQPQAFAMRVGDRWAAGMTTMEWTRIGLANQIAEQMPGFLRPVFPYSLFVGQLINSSDHYIALIAHESLHAFQGQQAADRLLAAETLRQAVERDYPWQDEQLIADWQAELDILQDALRTESADTRRELAAQFLAQRDARRQRAGLSDAQIDYEQEREWVEGGAKYTELTLWQRADRAASYRPLPAMAEDRDFSAYANADRQWRREGDQLTRMAADEGDGRFYYTGWAQATILDALAPGWQARYFDEDVTLELLLRAAVSQ